MSEEQFLPSLDGTWARLAQVAVKGAQYNSRERQPHPKCLEGTRVDLLKYIHRLLDEEKKNQLIWLHGTAGVGKSAVAFTVADRMKGLKMTEETSVEKRLAGTFFFSRKHTTRCTAAYVFATLAYQLANNFPSIRKDVNRVIRDSPALLDIDTPLCDQMEALFLKPLRWLQSRLRECPPLTFVIDALDECTSEPELTDLILSLAQALGDPDIPVTHILLTSRSETHISEAFQSEEVRPLLCEIPVKTSGEGVAAIISLDGADVDRDIYIFLQHSFTKLASRHSNFPQPTSDELAQLASRAGRRFIVASTMVKFIIDDEDKDPRDRLQLMLKLTSKLLPGTEAYKLYDCILSTCADPKRAYMHLSIVASLVDPLPLSEISSLLGPGLGRDVQTTLIQLRSVMDIPTDSTLPVNIYHSSVRDYVSDPSNCGLPQVCDITSPHSLLAHSSLRLMTEIPESTALLDALIELKKQSQAMQPEDPHRLKFSLSFLARPLEPLSVLICMLWLRGDRASDLQYWLDNEDGCAWVQTTNGRDWLQTERARDWLQTKGGRDWLWTEGGQHWLQTEGARDWLQTKGGRDCLLTEGGRDRLQTERGRGWLQTWRGRDWLQTWRGREWLQSVEGREWLQTQGARDWLQTEGGRDWFRTWRGRDWLRTEGGRDWLKTEEGRDCLHTKQGRDWLQADGGRDWLQTEEGRDWLQTNGGRDWLQTKGRREWLQSEGGREWLQTEGGREWLQTEGGQEWLQTERGREWLQTQGGREWLQTQGGREWLQTQGARDCLQSVEGQDRLQTERTRECFQTRSGQIWLETGGRDWLKTDSGRQWLKTDGGRQWLQTVGGRQWLQTMGGQPWLQTMGGQHWLQSVDGREWLQTKGAREWFQTWSGQIWLETGGREWLKTDGGREWLKTDGGRQWLRTEEGRQWLQTGEGRQWLQTMGGQDWLQTAGARDWLQTPHGQAWQSTPAGSIWATMKEFSSTLDAISKYDIVPELALLPTFKVVQLLKSLPDFLMFPMFLALIPQDHFTSASPEAPDREIIHTMNLFIAFAKEAQERSQSSSDALKYASQNWVVHLSHASNPWDDTLNHIFRIFWKCHLLSWLERQWCLKGLRSCLDILSEGQKLANVVPLLQFGPSTHSLINGCQLSVPISSTPQQNLRPPFSSPRPNTAELDVGTSRKRTFNEFSLDSNSALESDTSNSPSKRQK